MDLRKWLKSIGFEQHADAFEKDGIDLDVIADLDNDDLRDLGVSRLGDRKRILKAIAEFSPLEVISDNRQEPSQVSDIESADLHREVTLAQSHGSADYALHAAQPKDAENRQIAVMFCDLVGSTELSTRLDPEEYRDLIAGFQKTCRRAVESYAGFIGRYMGDGVLVYFGYPVASENDSDRAVFAALAVLEATENTQSRVRIGIATGRVIVGDLVGVGPAEERTVLGEAPNLAARLQALAQPGTAAVSPMTKLLTDSRFSFDSLGQHELKGFDHPIEVWRLLAEKTIESRFAGKRRPRVMKVVGRDAEQALLNDRWRQAQLGEGQTVFISGEAGIGKSSLVESLLGSIPRGECTVLRYQCSPYHTESALYPAIQQFQIAALINAGDSDDGKLEKLVQTMRRAGNVNESDLKLIARLLSIPFEHEYGELNGSPELIKSSTLSALIDQLHRLAQRQPVVLLFEDLHWIDPTTLILLESAMETLQVHRVLIVATHRPEWQPNYIGYTCTSLQLNRLGKSAGKEIVRNVVGDFVDDAAIERIVARTDGVPLFIEEVSKTLVESAFDDSEKIPETLHASLMARFDRLDAECRSVVLTASAIGREFQLELLTEASSHPPDLVARILERLVRSGLISHSGGVSSSRFLFKHALVQEVIYDTMLRKVRQTQHESIANALLAKFASVVENSPEVLGRHYFEAGNVELAVQQWRRAGLRYAGLSSNAEAVAQLRRAIDALTQLPEDSAGDDTLLLKLYIDSTGPMVASNGFTSTDTADHVEKSLALAVKAGDATEIFPTLYGRYIAHALGGKVDEAISYAKEFLMLAEREEKPEFVILGHRILGQAQFFSGDVEKAQVQLAAAIDIRVPPSETCAPYLFGHDIQTGPMCYLSWVQSYLGRNEGVLHWTTEAENRAREVGHANTIGYVLLHNAFAFAWSGMHEELETTLQKWQKFDNQNEVPAWRPLFDVVYCLRSLQSDGYGARLEQLKACAFANQSRGLLFVLPDLKSRQARLLATQGQFDVAREVVEEGLRLTAEGERFQLPGLLHASGFVEECSDAPADVVRTAYHNAMSVAREYGARAYIKSIQPDLDRYRA